MNEDEIVLEIDKSAHETFKRLDHFLTEKLNELSRSVIKHLFEQGLISYDSSSPVVTKKLELKKLPPIGSIINIQIPPPIPTVAQPENIPLDILYEDEHLIFVNKPAGLVTHPAPGHYTGTLVNAILHHCKDLQKIGDQIRPGIVHRLDKGTSGVMVVAKSKKCHEGLIKLFSTHDINRLYETIILGAKISSHGTIEANIGRHPVHRKKMAANVRNGKDAITNYKVLAYYNSLTHLEMKLETGRTHQIRVHLSSILKKPILCDETYGHPKDQLKRLGGEYQALLKDYPHPLLHAKTLGLVHPITKEHLEFTAPPPELFSKVLEIAKRETEK